MVISDTIYALIANFSDPLRTFPAVLKCLMPEKSSLFSPNSVISGKANIYLDYTLFQCMFHFPMTFTCSSHQLHPSMDKPWLLSSLSQ